LSIVEGVQSHYRLFGPYGVYLVAKARLSRKPLQVSVAAAGVKHPIHLRLRTTDVSVFEEILLQSEYEFDSNRQPAVIVDAGANIGMTSVYFANRYPTARIFSIEPEAGNFAMLEKNAAPYLNIVPIQSALWKATGMVSLSDPGSGSWGFQTGELSNSEAGAPPVRAITIDALMCQFDLDFIDVLKVDIEGSEKEVFESCTSWIDRVGILIVELHDRWKSGCSRSVYSAAKDFPIEWTRGETTFFFRPEYFRAPFTTPLRSPEKPVEQPTTHVYRPRIVAVQG
jgi:FkbM family methyltransferase